MKQVTIDKILNGKHNLKKKKIKKLSFWWRRCFWNPHNFNAVVVSVNQSRNIWSIHLFFLNENISRILGLIHWLQIFNYIY